jgi:hypothetical protein
MAKAKQKAKAPRGGTGIIMGSKAGAKVGAKAGKQLRKDSGAAVTESEVRKALSNLSAKTIAEIAGAIVGGPAGAAAVAGTKAARGPLKLPLGTQRGSKALRRLSQAGAAATRGRVKRGKSKK